MSKASEALKTIGCFNPHNVAVLAAKHGLRDVYLHYRTADNGRGGRAAAWQVVKASGKTDPEGFWYNNGHKTFAVYRIEDRDQRLDEAAVWADLIYGISDWVKIPGASGAMFPAEVGALVKRLLKESGGARTDIADKEGKK